MSVILKSITVPYSGLFQRGNTFVVCAILCIRGLIFMVLDDLCLQFIP